MANWTTPRTWPDAYLVGASDLNQQLRDNMTALYDTQHDVAPRVTRVTPNYTMHVGANASGAAEVFSDFSWSSDGSPVVVEFFCGAAQAVTNQAAIVLTDGTGTIITVLGIVNAGSTVPVFAKYYYLPVAGTRTLNVVGVVASGGSGTVFVGNGGTSVTSYPPAYLRVYGQPI